MNIFTNLLFVFVCISCNENTSEKSLHEVAEISQNTLVQLPKAFDAPYVVKHKDYELIFKMKKKNATTAILNIEVTPLNNSWYVSPLDTKDYKGKFKLDFGVYKNITLNGQMTANPSFHQVEKEIIEGQLISKDAIRSKTTYTQEINLKTTEDFMVMGRVQFVIEPRCTLEQIPLQITYKYGRFEITNANC